MITRFQGPLVASGSIALPGASPVPGDGYNDTPGPSLFAHGTAIADNRYMPVGGGDVTNVIPCWYAVNEVLVVDQIPTLLSAVNIVAAAVPTAGTAMTLAIAATGITIVGSGGFSLGGSFPTVAAGARVIDGLPAMIQLGALGGGVSMYDPRKAVARNLRVTSAGDDTGGFVTITGADLYGAPLRELFTLSTAGVISGLKAFKFVTQVLPSGTLSGSNISVGTGDVYGFPLASYEFQQVKIYWAGTLISASTGYLAAVTTDPSTAILGDVRGTYATQSASDTSKPLVVYVTPSPWHLTQSGIFGVKQYGG